MPKDTLLRPRVLASNGYYALIGILFTLVFFGSFFYQRSTMEIVGDSSAHRYFALYGIYVPLAIGIIVILKSYVLLGLTHILGLRFFIVKLFIYLLMYGFFLVLAVQLVYFEPRYTDVAIVLIDAYGLPLLIASSTSILLVSILAFFWKK